MIDGEAVEDQESGFRQDVTDDPRALAVILRLAKGNSRRRDSAAVFSCREQSGAGRV
jgi:hypothetical protein